MIFAKTHVPHQTTNLKCQPVGSVELLHEKLINREDLEHSIINDCDVLRVLLVFAHAKQVVEHW